MIERLLPPEHLRALDEGELLIIAAIPFNKSKDTLRFGFNKKAVFHAKETPNGLVWISNRPLLELPQSLTSAQVVETIIHTIMETSKGIGGCMIDIMIADMDKTVNN